MRPAAEFVILGTFILSAILVFLFGKMVSPTPTDTCLKDSFPSGCFVEKVHDLTMSGDLAEALDYAVDIVAPYSRSTVHRTMHMIGHAAWEKFQNRAEAMAVLPPEAFTNEHYLIYEGYQHGLLQSYFKAKKSTTPIDSLIKESCGEFYVAENTPTEDYTWRARRQCFHAVGHGLMSAYGNNIEQVLPICVRLPYEWMRDRCSYGAFMELGYLYDPNYYPGDPRPSVVGESMASVCAATTKFKELCYSFVGRSYFIRHPENFRGAFDSCKEVPSPYDSSCRRDIADVLITNAGSDFKEMQNRCEKAAPYDIECLMNIARAVKNGYAGEAAQKKDFCASLETPLREQCSEEVPNR